MRCLVSIDGSDYCRGIIKNGFQDNSSNRLTGSMVSVLILVLIKIKTELVPVLFNVVVGVA